MKAIGVGAAAGARSKLAMAAVPARCLTGVRLNWLARRAVAQQAQR